jgi:membrane-associated phospholipid phosphatase
MHWLQSLDTALFHFINGSLGNPFFDWLMPILSGNSWFIPLAVLLVLGVLCFGSTRARLCALLIFMVVALGDPLVVNTIKKTIARPRPCLTLPYVVERLGCTTSGSMPSAHAANWAAMTMILFLFYRRSLWFMLPLTLGVAFSRIYNGVHYPSDVLAGLILGAGYAVALAVTINGLWQYLGQRFFPEWHKHLPSLLSPIPTPIAPEPIDTSSHWLRLSYFLIVVCLIGRWIYLATPTLGLVEDEAYQWVWSKHLALSYYSKPPGIALIQYTSTSLFGDTAFGVRFFSPLFAALLSFMVVRFFAREVSAKSAFWLLMIVMATPLLGIGTILMTIDPPMVLCWMWALIAGWRAWQSDGQTRYWLEVGLATGLGFLCKYTAMCQLVSWALFFLLLPAARRQLRQPGPWLALLIFLICTTPVLIWNAQNGWITVRHVAGDAGLHSHWRPTLNYFYEFMATQFGLLNPVFFVGALWAAIGFWNKRRERPLMLYFFCMGAPVYLGYWLWSFHSRILPNWIAPAVPPIFCLMVCYWRERPRLIRPWLAVGIALGLFVVILFHQTALIAKITGSPLPGEIDPTHRARGQRETAEVVESAREKLATQGQPAFIIADHYGLTGELSFYLPAAHDALKSEPLVYCVDSDKPMNQFYFWANYRYRQHRPGQNAIYASIISPYPLEPGWLWKWLTRQQVEYDFARIPPSPYPPPRMVQEFESVTDLGIQEVRVHDQLIRRLHLWACYHLK